MCERKPKGVTDGLRTVLDLHPVCMPQLRWLLSGLGSRENKMYKRKPKGVTDGLGAALEHHPGQDWHGSGRLLSRLDSKELKTYER